MNGAGRKIRALCKYQIPRKIRILMQNRQKPIVFRKISGFGAPCRDPEGVQWNIPLACLAVKSFMISEILMPWGQTFSHLWQAMHSVGLTASAS